MPKPQPQSPSGQAFDRNVDENLAREWHDWSALRTHLHFSPQDGRIWFDSGRMLLIDVATITAIRRELIDSLGTERARGILARVGAGAGNRDAQLARRMRPGASAQELLSVGPQLHALKGATAVEPIRFDVSVERGHYSAEFNWLDSSEVDSHVASYGRSAKPVCWMQTGYASGYISAIMGKQVLHREVQCRAMGHPYCKVIGKPLDEWEDADQERPQATVPAAALGSSSPAFGDLLVGASSGFVTTCHMIERVASTNATVLLLGETGVGKEMFARALHRMSERADKPFVGVNCAALPENLVEAELFGVEKGAFTGAAQSRPGRFERANGGTLFLDEISTLHPTAQAKLLRVLQERAIERVGDIRERKVDVRLIAATNTDLYKDVNIGQFRSDLLFRLDVFSVHIPPLRERRDDIPALIEHFLKRFASLHKRNIVALTERAVRRTAGIRLSGQYPRTGEHDRKRRNPGIRRRGARYRPPFHQGQQFRSRHDGPGNRRFAGRRCGGRPARRSRRPDRNGSRWQPGYGDAPNHAGREGGRQGRRQSGPGGQAAGDEPLADRLSLPETAAPGSMTGARHCAPTVTVPTPPCRPAA